MKSKNNLELFICRTPLQAFIAKHIIKNSNNTLLKNVIYIPLSNNRMQRLYFDSLMNYADQGVFYVLDERSCKIKKLFDMICVILVFILRYGGRNFKTIYLASIDDELVQLFLSKCNFEELKTFDDGSANYTSSSFYNDKKGNFFVRLITKTLGRKYSKFSIKKISKEHFALSNLPNIIENTTKLNVLNVNPSNFNEERNVLMGTRYESFTRKDKVQTLKSMIRKVTSNIDFDYYFPHPREEIDKNVNFCNVEDSRISEEKIIDLLNVPYFVNIYTFPSSTILNLIELNNVFFHIFIVNGNMENEVIKLLEIRYSNKFEIINISI